MFGVDVVALEEAARKAAGTDVSLWGDGDKMAAAVGIARVVSLLSAALAHLTADLDAHGGCERETGLSTGSWLARETGLPKVVARRSVEVGRGLRDLPVIDEAVADGRLTVEHAQHVAKLVTPRVADAVAVVQDQIVAWAGDCGFEVWARQVSALVELLDQDGPDPGDDPVSELTLAPTTDGVTFLKGRLAGADAVLVRQTLEAKADELFHRYKRDHDETGGAVDIPPRSVLLALALVEICRLANARDIGSSKPARPDVTVIVRAGQRLDDDEVDAPTGREETPSAGEPTEGQGDHDATSRDRKAACAKLGPESATDEHDDVVDRDHVSDVDDDVTSDAVRRATGEPLVPHRVGASELSALAGLVLPGDVARTDIPVPLFAPTWPEVTDLTGVRLQDATTRALLCDPDLHALIVDGLGVPLDLGRTARYANDDQRRALLVRDGGCIFPGCDRPPGWCDAHHVDAFQPVGLTDLVNLALLCRRHHGISHRRGWTMHATDDQWFWWTAPNGQTFWSQRHGHRRSGPTPA